MTKLVLMVGGALALSAATPAFSQNLVKNGSFESGFTNWMVSHPNGDASPPIVFAYNNAGNYPTGAYGEAVKTDNATSLSPDAVGSMVAYFSSDTANPDAITQSISLVGGTLYNLGFDYYVPLNGYNNTFDSTLSLVIGGVPVPGGTVTAGSVTGTTPQTWFNFNTTFRAPTSTTTDLSFQFRGLGVTAADFAIDRVYVTAATGAVPEPASWLMMILGVGLMGSVVRRRRQAGATGLATV